MTLVQLPVQTARAVSASYHCPQINFQKLAVQLKSIQYVRAIAALLVVFYHVTIYLKTMKGDALLHDIFGGSPGLYGVISFFIVTGYLMADIAPKYRPSTFLMHRVLRIYPTYWLCVLLAGVFYIWLWLASAANADYIPSLQIMLLWVSSSLLLITAMALALLVSAVLGQLDMACYRKLKGLYDSASPRFHQVFAAGFIAVFFTAALLGLK